MRGRLLGVLVLAIAIAPVTSTAQATYVHSSSGYWAIPNNAAGSGTNLGLVHLWNPGSKIMRIWKIEASIGACSQAANLTFTAIRTGQQLNATRFFSNWDQFPLDSTMQPPTARYSAAPSVEKYTWWPHYAGLASHTVYTAPYLPFTLFDAASGNGNPFVIRPSQGLYVFVSASGLYTISCPVSYSVRWSEDAS